MSISLTSILYSLFSYLLLGGTLIPSPGVAMWLTLANKQRWCRNLKNIYTSELALPLGLLPLLWEHDQASLLDDEKTSWETWRRSESFLSSQQKSVYISWPQSTSKHVNEPSWQPLLHTACLLLRTPEATGNLYILP